MYRSYYKFLFVFLFITTVFQSFASDTLYISEIKKELELNEYIYIYEDVNKSANVYDLLIQKNQVPFYKNAHPNLNFRFTRSTIWLKIILKNIGKDNINAYLEVSNADLDYVSYYEVHNDSVLHSIRTGELTNVNSREIYSRNYLFPIFIPPGENYTYFISVNNNGHSCTIPIILKEKSHFEKHDIRSELFSWLIYGFLIFIMIFNIYLFYASKDKVNLYYSVTLLFAILTFLHLEGYLYFFNPPVIIEKIKWLNPALFTVFLLLFTKSFISNDNRFKSIIKLIKPLIFLSLIGPFAYNLKFPFSLLADIGIPLFMLFTFILIIIMSSASLKKGYYPSYLFLGAFIIVFLGLLIHQLKEFNLINSNFFVVNSTKIGFTIQNLILTIAVLERFRLSQERDKQTIRENLKRIEIQNREFEIINTELEKLSIVASETDNSVAIYDNEGRLEWCNTGFEKLYESKINELIKSGRDNIKYIIPNKNIGKYLKICLESKLSVVFETSVISGNEDELWVQTTLSPYIRSGKIHKIIAIDSDITSLKTYEKELKAAKEKAEESDHLKTAFLHNISHEIRTPMNAIVGFSGFLNDPKLTQDKRKQFSDIVIQSSNQLLAIITDIINIASIEAGQERVAEYQIHLPSTLEYIQEQFTLTAKERNIALTVQPCLIAHNEIIYSDETKLVQILTNLIGNAIKFTEKGIVNFGYSIKGLEIEFFVEDSGMGIPADMHQEIFKRFRQVESTNERQFGGSGLGLSISKAYVELLGGKIWLRSELNKGTTFYFTIPYKVNETIPVV